MIKWDSRPTVIDPTCWYWPLTSAPDQSPAPAPVMSLMFAKQFSEAGVTNTASSGGKRPGRGRGAGSGVLGKSKRGGRTPDDAGDTSGLFNMDNNYRTHMLFPGRKDEDGCGGEPRRSSGSPGFMKAMMSWGKRPSDPKAAAAGNAQELARYRGTPTRASESEFESLLGDRHHPPLNSFRKTVSFHNFRDTGSSSPPEHVLPPRVPLTSRSTPPASYYSTSPSSPPSTSTNNPGQTSHFFSYHEPFSDNDYASYIGGNNPASLLPN